MTTDYMDRTVTLTLTDTRVSRKDLAIALKTIILMSSKYKQLLDVATALLKGLPVEIKYYQLGVAYRAGGVFGVIPIAIEAYVDTYAIQSTLQSSYFALRDKGAAGDVEAAIAYCKLEIAGKVNHSAMG